MGNIHAEDPVKSQILQKNRKEFCTQQTDARSNIRELSAMKNALISTTKKSKLSKSPENRSANAKANPNTIGQDSEYKMESTKRQD